MTEMQTHTNHIVPTGNKLKRDFFDKLIEFVSMQRVASPGVFKGM